MSENKPTGVINIHGRQYETVALRVKRFRETPPPVPEFSVVTEILHRDPEVVIVRATISDSTGRVLATGHAEEWRKASSINKTSAIENAETSAIGRALASLGMGGTEFASANELESAKRKEQVDPPTHNPSDLKHAAFDRLPEEAQAVTREWAMEVIALVGEDRVEEAAQFVIDNCGTDQESLLALSSQLPPGVSKKVKEEMMVLRRKQKDAARAANHQKEAA
jgi:hypothetical protein